MNKENYIKLKKFDDFQQRFIEFVENNLKGETVTNNVNYTIWYNIKEDKFFELTKPSSNWSFIDDSHLICLLALNNGAYCTKHDYLLEAMNDLGKDFIDEYEECIKNVNEIKEKINGHRIDIEIKEEIIDAMNDDCKEEIFDIMWQQDLNDWILRQFRETLAYYNEKYRL